MLNDQRGKGRMPGLDKVTTVSLLFILIGLGCSQKKVTPKSENNRSKFSSTSMLPISADIYKKVPFIDRSLSAAPYLAMNVAFEPLAEIRRSIEHSENIVLKHRGEAHITVIAPPEFDQLKSGLSAKLINEVALLNRIQETPFQIICLGKGEKHENGKVVSTFFIVVDAPALRDLRQKIVTLSKTQGKSPVEVKPDDYNPHITVGFTERDLHAEDGVFKNKATCFSQMQIKAQSALD
ncbi:MAG: hypothetical protein JNL11_01085 [Bdellovibrionaceae bacterium]|nr:hypothetical protein [Pseudobdellovibrionaceae bacterium]